VAGQDASSKKNTLDIDKPMPESAEEESNKPLKKARGQNKNRPRYRREAVSDKLCPSLVRQQF